MSRTKVVLLGAGFIADIHMESYHRFVPDAEVVGIFARSPQRAEAFAKKHHIPRWFGELEAAMVDLGPRWWMYACRIFCITGRC